MPNQKNETKEPKTQKTPKDKVIDASVRGKKPAAAEHRYYQNRKRQQAAKKVAPVKIAFLGGLNEVGKNITLCSWWIAVSLSRIRICRELILFFLILPIWSAMPIKSAEL